MIVQANDFYAAHRNLFAAHKMEKEKKRERET